MSANKVREAPRDILASLEGRWDGVTSIAGKGRRFPGLANTIAELSGRRSSGNASGLMEEDGMRGSLDGGMASGSSGSAG